jgi:hypothetical protein
MSGRSRDVTVINSSVIARATIQRMVSEGSQPERMTQAEQAVLLWPLLAMAARTQQILSYAAVEGYTGIARHGLNRALGLIHDYCKRRGWPLLNTLVVSQQSGMPGEGFPEDLSPLEIKVEQGRVFLFDWSGHDKPRPHDFQAA